MKAEELHLFYNQNQYNIHQNEYIDFIYPSSQEPFFRCLLVEKVSQQKVIVVKVV